MPDDARARLLAALRDELATAQATARHRVSDHVTCWDCREYFNTQSPERTIRRVEALIAEVERHDPNFPWPKAYSDLAVRLGCAMYGIPAEAHS